MKDTEALNRIMSPQLVKLKERLIDNSNERFRFVGGCVRDSILKVIPKDIDICTTAIPSKMVDLAKKAGFPVILTGEKHGTVTVLVDSVPFEITTLRIDTDTDGRHAVVNWTTSFAKDAARRDFTINAISMDFNGNLYDYFDGLKDLKNNEVKFVGNARERVEEDYLRILRYFRFVARFNSSFDLDLLDMFKVFSIQVGLSKISKERVWSEISKILVSSSRLRVATGLQSSSVASVIGIRHSPAMLLDRADDAIAALATYNFTVFEAENLAKSWKMSLIERNKLIWLVKNKDNSSIEFIQDSIVNDIPRNWVVSHAMLCDKNVELAKTFSTSRFPVKGKDLLDLGYEPGITIGIALSTAKHAWMNSRFTMTKEELIDLIRN